MQPIVQSLLTKKIDRCNLFNYSNQVKVTKKDITLVVKQILNVFGEW